MSLRRVFVDQINEDKLVLTGKRYHHLTRVARLQLGEQIEVTDQIKLYTARVTEIKEKFIEFSLETEIDPPPRGQRVTLLLSVIKFARFEWAIEKTTELGVHSVVPIITDQCNHGLLKAAEKRVPRWQRIALEAAQQARLMVAPHIDIPVDFNQAITRTTNSVVFFLDRTGKTLHDSLIHAVTGEQNREIALWIGPEGGWSSRELEIARQHDFIIARLGANILRTETAAIAALATSIIEL